jgi:hypothetical protein
MIALTVGLENIEKYDRVKILIIIAAPLFTLSISDVVNMVNQTTF